MAKNIRLSPKYGINPTIAVCFWCGREKNEIALLGRISRKKECETAWGGTSTVLEKDVEAPRYSILDYEPCEKCRCGMEQGFTVMEATSEPNSRTSVKMQSGVYPTGRFVVLKREAADRVFGKEFASKGKAFMSVQDFSRMFRD